jgi:hypothetical protein
MVRGFVHEEHVWPAQQRARHPHAHLPAARESADVAVDPAVVESESVQHFPRLAFKRVAAEVFVFFLNFAEPREDAIQVVRPRRVGHRLLQVVQFVVQVARPTTAGDDLVENRPPGHLPDVLPEVADGHLLRHRDFAVVGALFAHNHAKQRRLAAAVGSDEAYFFARIELKRGVHEQQLLAVLLGDVGESDHKRRIVQQPGRIG